MFGLITIQHFYVMPIQFIYGLCVVLRTNAIISLNNTNWMVLRQRYYNLKYSGHDMYRQIIIQHFYVLATEWNNWLWEDLRSNIFYFPIQNYMSGLYDRDFTICSPLITVYTARLTFNFTTFCHRVNFCVLWGSVNKRRLFPYATLTDISIQQRFQHLKPNGHYMYRQIIIQHFYVLSIQCIYWFYVNLRNNSEYFPKQNYTTGLYNWAFTV